jgi:programmed cell death protein 5
MDEDLENLKKKRLQELQQQMSMQEAMDEQQDQQKQEFEEQKKMILRAILDDSARERLGRIKIARPEVAEVIENQLIMLAQTGKLKNKINDEQLRMLLSKLFPKKKDITIRRR